MSDNINNGIYHLIYTLRNGTEEEIKGCLVGLFQTEIFYAFEDARLVLKDALLSMRELMSRGEAAEDSKVIIAAKYLTDARQELDNVYEEIYELSLDLENSTQDEFGYINWKYEMFPGDFEDIL